MVRGIKKESSFHVGGVGAFGSYNMGACQWCPAVTDDHIPAMLGRPSPMQQVC